MIRKLIFIQALLALMCFVKCSSDKSTKNNENLTITNALLPSPKPLYRDPIHDGAADPVLCFDREKKKWLMFYTNRRANVENTSGVGWVHGTRIGIAESQDFGSTWKYLDTANINFRKVADYTHWAPEVIAYMNTFHMYLTFVPGVFESWSHPRNIVHLTSKDLINWDYQSTLKLSSDKVIDACVFQLQDGTWRMWYNNEKDAKSIYFADSPDLYQWTDKGKALGDRPGEGPVVFSWKGKYWMIVDVWKGLGVYYSDDLLNWTRQENNLAGEPGTGLDDQVIGRHADVVVSGEKAYLFYFTHPGHFLSEEACEGYAQRRSSIQVTELIYNNGVLECDRNVPTYVDLNPDSNKKGNP